MPHAPITTSRFHDLDIYFTAFDYVFAKHLYHYSTVALQNGFVALDSNAALRLSYPESAVYVRSISFGAAARLTENYLEKSLWKKAWFSVSFAVSLSW